MRTVFFMSGCGWGDAPWRATGPDTECRGAGIAATFAHAAARGNGG
jgi:hypothetical protein